MKKRYLGVMILLLGIITFVFYNSEVNPVIENNKNTNNFSTSTLSINLETAAGSGVYEEATNSLWPSEGFTFNAELSKCENGSEVSWDEANKKVIVSSNKSDKCYVYFDKINIFTDYIIGLYTTQGSNNLYHHDGTLENGINDGSYRYSGSYEATNNWVCFGTDADTCDDEHLYRIIGVFNSVIVDDAGNATTETERRVKLIKAYEGTETSLGTTPFSYFAYDFTFYKGKLDQGQSYIWSGSTSNQNSNWTTSTLNTDILNRTYLTTLGINWSDKIATTEWKVGGNTWANILEKNASTAYQYEVTNPATNIVYNPKYNFKVGLMYASDYGFAESPSKWATNLYNYTYINAGWMFLGASERTISPVADDSANVFYLHPYGGVNRTNASNGCIVRPTFYLNSDVIFTGGTGTESDPYRID